MWACLRPGVAERGIESSSRLGSSRSTDRGWGLKLGGVSIGSAVVAALNGTVTVVTSPSGGTTFIFASATSQMFGGTRRRKVGG